MSLYSLSTRFPKNCAAPSDSSTCLNGRLSTVTQASTIMLSDTALSWLKSGEPRFASLMALTAMRASLMGLSRSWYTDISAPARSGFLALVVISRNVRCARKPSWTLAACSATRPPRLLLRSTNLATGPSRNASNSSMVSGRGSTGAAAALGGAGGAGAEVAGVEIEDSPEAGEAMDCCRPGTAWGSSMVDDAMSSSRAVAASRLGWGVSTGTSGPLKPTARGAARKVLTA